MIQYMLVDLLSLLRYNSLQFFSPQGAEVASTPEVGTGMDPTFTLSSVAFQMAPVSVRQTEDEGTTTTEFALVPSGTQPLIAVTNGQYISGATVAVGAQPEDETLSPRKKCVSSRLFSGANAL